MECKTKRRWGIDLTGRRIRFLTVIKKIRHREFPCGVKQVLWECRCVCGKRVEATTVRLVSTCPKRSVKSCGCKNIKRGWTSIKKQESPEMSSFQNLFDRYHLRARRKKLTFQLSLSEAIQIFRSDCRYCGTKPDQKFNYYICNNGLASKWVRDQKWASRAWISYNGIDRVNNLHGYVAGNIVPCCSFCNFAKGQKTEAEFLAWIDRLVQHRKGRRS